MIISDDTLPDQTKYIFSHKMHLPCMQMLCTNSHFFRFPFYSSPQRKKHMRKLSSFSLFATDVLLVRSSSCCYWLIDCGVLFSVLSSVSVSFRFSLSMTVVAVYCRFNSNTCSRGTDDFVLSFSINESNLACVCLQLNQIFDFNCRLCNKFFWKLSENYLRL